MSNNIRNEEKQNLIIDNIFFNITRLISSEITTQEQVNELRNMQEKLDNMYLRQQNNI